VIALQDRTIERTHPFQAFEWLRGVTHDIPETNTRAHVLSVHIREDSSEGIRICVDVRKDGPRVIDHRLGLSVTDLVMSMTRLIAC